MVDIIDKHQQQQRHYQELTKIDLTNPAYQNFINSLKSKETRSVYARVFRKYLHDNNVTIETLLNLPVKDSEQLLINHIEKSKAQDKSHSYLNQVFCSIKHFYVMNDIRINKEKISKFLGESGRKNTDRGYTHEEIKKILDVADLRMKTIIILMASTGIRLGAVADLKLKHLEEINKDKQNEILQGYSL